MRILVTAVGRGRSEPAQRLFDDYVGRLPWAAELREIQESRRLAPEQLKEAEGQLLLQAIPDRAVVIALDGGGQALSSEAFAERIGRWRDDGVGTLAFLIGGAEGLSEAALARADLRLSLGPMTWPHLLVRAMLAEQLWRAASILSGHPYHRA